MERSRGNPLIIMEKELERYSSNIEYQSSMGESDACANGAT